MNARRLFASLAAALALMAAPAALSDEAVITSPKAVVELFTSQGCASCPKADRLLTDLAARDDLVALAWHVDYWDYIGWPDTFGAPEHTARQRGYAKVLGNRMFTPQMVINGAGEAVGSKRDQVMAQIAESALSVPVGLSIAEGMLHIAIPPQTGGGEAVLWLVSFIDRADVNIERGENAGKTVTYSRVVRGRQALGMWSGNEAMALTLPLDQVLADGTDGAALLLQQESRGLPGRIIGAAAFNR